MKLQWFNDNSEPELFLSIQGKILYVLILKYKVDINIGLMVQVIVGMTILYGSQTSLSEHV